MAELIVPCCKEAFCERAIQLQLCTSVSAAPAIKSASCVTYLKYYTIETPTWTHSSANVACCNMPGVLTAGRCCTSLSSTYIECVVPTSKHSPQLNSTGLYNTASHSSICMPRVYVRLSLFFLEVPFQGKQPWKRVRRSWANKRKHLHI